jgi:transposase-like protein
MANVARKLDVAEQTFYRWKKEYGGLDPEQKIELRSFTNRTRS